jgi:hypothetical protein
MADENENKSESCCCGDGGCCGGAGKGTRASKIARSVAFGVLIAAAAFMVARGLTRDAKCVPGSPEGAKTGKTAVGCCPGSK